ncbi:TPA: hypothetical protein ACGOXN_001057 [Streptococcus suis]
MVKSDKVKETYTGQVSEIGLKEITIKSSTKYHLIQVDDILDISMIEELDDE